ncbi:MAG: putative ATPase/class 3 adenylate cyclase, partial [Candidatus Latescibacterota bacterium]
AGQTAWLAELRRVTILFVYLPNLNAAPVKRLEQNQQVIGALQTLVERFEGSINKLSVDDKGASLLVAFGLPPLAHEDDPVRGVEAAIAMQAELEELGEEAGIGITTTRVFCGSVGSEARREYTMIGEGVNRAARLMQATSRRDLMPPGHAILCDEETRKAAAREFTALPPIELRGIAEPVVAYIPLDEVKGTVHASTNLVGRKAERRIIDEQIERLVSERTSGAILIEGEPGLGKSRLVEYVCEQARGLTCLVGAASAIEKNTPYLAWRAVFQTLFGINPQSDDPQAAQDSARAHLESFPHYLPLAALINPVLPCEFEESETSRQYADQRRSAKSQSILTDLLGRAAEQSPLVLVIEDAHWLDAASWTLLQRVRTEVSPLLLVVATRPMPEARPAEYDQLAHSDNAQKLVLDSMAPEETLSLVRQRLGVDQLPDPVANLIREKAQGNPFFSEEIAYALRDSGQIQVVDNTCILAPGLDNLDSLNFPDTVQGVITSRIDRLTPQQQLGLKVASAIGRIFPFATFAEIYPIAEDQHLLRDTTEALNELEITLLETPDPDLSYIFKHIIIRDVAYNLMLYAQREQLHRTIAEFLEKSQTQEQTAQYPLLAHHWSLAAGEHRENGTAVAKARFYWQGAGEQAMAAGAFPDAVVFFRQALDYYESLPKSEQRVEEELELIKSLGTATFTTSGYGAEETLSIYDRAWVLCQQIGDTPEVFPALWGLWLTYHFSAETDKALELGEKMMALARKVGDDELILQAHHALWTTLMLIPDYERAHQHLEKGIALYRPEMHQSHCIHYGGHDPGMCGQRALCLTHWARGYPDQAIAAGLRSIELSQSHHYSAITAQMSVAFIYKQCGDLEKAHEHATAIVERANTQGFPGFTPWAEIILGWVQAQQGDLAAGLEVVLASCEKLGYKEPGYMSILVELYCLAEEPVKGLEWIEAFFAIVESKNEHHYEPELYRLKGELLAQQGAADAEVKSNFHLALDTARKQGAKSFELRAATGLARFTAERERPTEGKEVLTAIYSWFNEGFDSEDLRRAKALLDTL